jgi:hypothetical protein
MGLPSAPEVLVSDERPLLARWFDPGKYPLQQRIENKKRGIGRQRYPVVGPYIRLSSIASEFDIFIVWALTVIMVAVFIYELVVNAQAQGSPVSFHVGLPPGTYW